MQFLTNVDPAVQNHLTSLAWQGHRQNRGLNEICAGLSALSKAMGYEAAIGVQEVTTENMPSYPGQKVMTALIMIDIRPAPSRAEPQKRAPGTERAKEYHRAN